MTATRSVSAFAPLAMTLFLALNMTDSIVLAQGTAFTYQGILTETNAPAQGVYDFEFRVFDLAVGGTQQGVTVTVDNLAVTNGLFQATLDPGANVFTGPGRWLNIAVRPGASAGNYTSLTPRQPITPAPYAIYAGAAAVLDGILSSSQLIGTYSKEVIFDNPANIFIGEFVGDGISLTNLSATNLIGVIPASALNHAWKLGGNADTTAGPNFLGTTDDEPLEIKVNGLRVFRFEPNTEIAPNVIGGASVNYAAPSVVGATIGGGGTLNYLGLGAVESNSVFADFGTIGGGWSNVVEATAVSGTVAGGYGNTVGGPDATVGGGNGNQAGGTRATITGGQNNSAGGDWAAIGGGAGNVAGNLYSVIAGGSGNDVFGSYSAIGGGSGNLVDVGAERSTIAGGQGNVIGLDYASVGGGLQNTNLGNYSTVGGGRQNTIAVSADYSVIAGGRSNALNADYAFAAGRRAKASHNGAFVWADSTDADFATIAADEFALRASGGFRFIGSPTLGTLMVAPNEALDGDNSQLLLAEDDDGTFGMAVAYNGTTNELQILGKTGTGFTTPHVVVARNSGNTGIKRSPTANDLEVEGTASKTAAGDWLANSDARIKQDIQPVTDALAKMDRVRLVSFRYNEAYRKNHPSLEDRRYLNVIAQEFREVFPEHVKASGEKLPDGSEILQVDAYPLTIYAAAAVQELNLKVERLENELRSRNADNEQLRRRLERIEQRLSQDVN